MFKSDLFLYVYAYIFMVFNETTQVIHPVSYMNSSIIDNIENFLASY